jgi:putative endonuclease
MKRPYFVYLLECGDKSIYAGITTDITRRFNEHKAGIGSHYTRSRKAIKIVYTEKFPSRNKALKREAEIKKLPRKNKLILIKKSA